MIAPILAQISETADIAERLLTQLGLGGFMAFLGAVVLLAVAIVMYRFSSVAGLARDQQKENTKQSDRIDKLQEHVTELRILNARTETKYEESHKRHTEDRQLWSKERSELQAQIAELRLQLIQQEKAIQELKAQRDQASKDLADVKDQLRKAIDERDSAQLRIKELERKVKDLEASNQRQATTITEQSRQLEQLNNTTTPIPSETPKDEKDVA